MAMTKEFLNFLLTCIQEDNIHSFYNSGEWQSLRQEVLSDDKSECQRCRDRGVYTKANTVHHINHVKDKPELALDKFYIDEDGKEQRNLISLCHDCHEQEHGYRIKFKRKKPLTEEKW